MTGPRTMVAAGALALAAVAGIVGMLLAQGAWDGVFFAMALLPLLVGTGCWWRRRGRAHGGNGLAGAPPRTAACSVPWLGREMTVKKLIVPLGLLAAVVVAGVVAAIGLRPPPVEPFVPTAEEAEQLALYRQPESWFLQRLGRPPIEIDGQRLDPKFQHMIEQAGDTAMAARAMRLLFATSAGRRYVRARGDRGWILFSKVTAPMRKVEDRQVEGRRGPIHVRVYWPETETAGPLPILVYAHGGGYLFGSVAALDRAVRLMANEAGVIAISVDYRLAPEHPYPAASDDGEDVFLWARANAAALGGDPQRIAFGGDSAGGHVAINVAQRQVLKGEPPPAMLLLYYPAPGLPHGDRSFELFGKGYGLDASFFDYLLPKVFPGRTLDDARDDLMEPLRARSLEGLPPTILSTAGFDILRDSGRAFAERLRSEGVPVVYRNYPSLIHSFLQFSGVIADADTAATETARMLGAGLRTTDAPFEPAADAAIP